MILATHPQAYVLPLHTPEVIFTNRVGKPDSYLPMNPALHIAKDGSFTLLVRTVNYRKFPKNKFALMVNQSDSRYYLVRGNDVNAIAQQVKNLKGVKPDYGKNRTYPTYWTGLEDIRFISVSSLSPFSSLSPPSSLIPPSSLDLSKEIGETKALAGDKSKELGGTKSLAGDLSKELGGTKSLEGDLSKELTGTKELALLVIVPEIHPFGIPYVFPAKLCGDIIEVNPISNSFKSQKQPEKNWLPLANTNHVIYQISPLLVIRDYTNDQMVSSLNHDRKFLSEYHGSTNSIIYQDQHLCIIHKGKEHRWFLLSPDYQSFRVSEPFTFFPNTYIEFCCSLSNYQKDLYFGVGVNDREAYVVKLPISIMDQCSWA